MSKRITTIFLTIAAAALVAALTAGAGLASSHAAKLRVVPIVMADPGCHWFHVGGKNTTRLTVQGPTAFRNLDEAALVFQGPHFLQKVAVGKSITVAKPGTYHITMVHQSPDDNHLVLVVK